MTDNWGYSNNLEDNENDAAIPAVVTSLESSSDIPADCQLEIRTNGFNYDATASDIDGFTDVEVPLFLGQHVRVGTSKNGSVKIKSTIDDMVVKVTGVQAGFKTGFYVGSLYSASEIYDQIDPLVDLKMTVTAQATQVIVVNFTEDRNIVTPSLPIHKFPIYVPCKILYTYENGVIVVGIKYNAPKLAKITAKSGTRTFNYTVQRIASYDATQTLPKDKWVTDGVNITGVTNRLELGGTPTYTEGTGVSITNTDGTVNSGSCKMVAIGIGTVIDLDLIYDASFAKHYSFAQPNSAQ